MKGTARKLSLMVKWYLVNKTLKMNDVQNPDRISCPQLYTNNFECFFVFCFFVFCVLRFAFWNSIICQKSFREEILSAKTGPYNFNMDSEGLIAVALIMVVMIRWLSFLCQKTYPPFFFVFQENKNKPKCWKMLYLI